LQPPNNGNVTSAAATANGGSDVLSLAKTLVTSQDVDTLLAEISLAVERMTSSEAASLLLLDATKKQLVFKIATGEKGSSVKRFYVPLGKGVAGWVAENQQPVVLNDVQSDTRFTGQIDKSSGFSTRSILAVPMTVNGQLIGVAEALNKVGGIYTDHDRKTMENLASLAAAAIHNARLAEDYRNFFSHIIEIITMAVEGSDSKLTGHSYRVAELACKIGRQMGFVGDDYRDLYYAGILHDIGMVAVHDLRYLPSVLSKTIERTPEKLHPLVGSELVKDIKLLGGIAPIIRHHHEFVDGTGHPGGLVGDDIPLASRILCLVEHLDELRMDGYMGEAFDAAAQRLAQDGAGTKFDKSFVDAFLSLPR
jgi:HD-GYP domain-containing protein (c-di-GMP phosphodiesterase class II)